MTEEFTQYKVDATIIENIIGDSDLAKLNPQQRVIYYQAVCKSLQLNPLTKPFGYIRINNKLVLYPLKSATDQLRQRDSVSIGPLLINYKDDLIIVTATATNKDNRTDTDVGAVVIGHLKGEAKANAVMKAITKAKRRVTLSICGLGWLDESELDTIPDDVAQPVNVNVETGEIIDTPRKPAHSNGGAPAVRPFSPDVLKQTMNNRLAKMEEIEATDSQRGLLVGKLNEVWSGDDDADNKRRTVLIHLFDVDSSKKLTGAQVNLLLDWLVADKDDTGDYLLKGLAVKEAHAIVKQYQADAGQQDMFGEEITG